MYLRFFVDPLPPPYLTFLLLILFYFSTLAYSTFLASGRDGSKTNGELLSDYSIACRGGIKLLTQGMFGPPTVYDMFIVGCSGDCQRWDALQQQGRSSSRCSCEDLDTCDQVTSFWL